MSLAWGGYQNGRIPASALIEGAQPDAHRQWYAMRDACHAATGVWLGTTEAYRDYATQLAYYRNPPKSMGKPVVVAYPGTSNHGWGRARDISNYSRADVWAWLLANAWRYGYSWATGKASGERWHWEYVGAITAAGGNATPIDNTPVLKITRGTTMRLSGTTTGGGMLTTEFGTTAVNGQEYTLLRRLIISDQTRNANLGGDFPEVFLSVEYAIIDAALARTHPAPANVTFDPTALIAQIVAAVKANGGSATAEQIAAATLDMQAERLGNG